MDQETTLNAMREIADLAAQPNYNPNDNPAINQTMLAILKKYLPGDNKLRFTFTQAMCALTNQPWQKILPLEPGQFVQFCVDYLANGTAEPPATAAVAATPKRTPKRAPAKQAPAPEPPPAVVEAPAPPPEPAPQVVPETLCAESPSQPPKRRPIRRKPAEAPPVQPASPETPDEVMENDSNESQYAYIERRMDELAQLQLNGFSALNDKINKLWAELRNSVLDPSYVPPEEL